MTKGSLFLSSVSLLGRNPNLCRLYWCDKRAYEALFIEEAVEDYMVVRPPRKEAVCGRDDYVG